MKNINNDFGSLRCLRLLFVNEPSALVGVLLGLLFVLLLVEICSIRNGERLLVVFLPLLPVFKCKELLRPCCCVDDFFFGGEFHGFALGDGEGDGNDGAGDANNGLLLLELLLSFGLSRTGVFGGCFSAVVLLFPVVPPAISDVLLRFITFSPITTTGERLLFPPILGGLLIRRYIFLLGSVAI